MSSEISGEGGNGDSPALRNLGLLAEGIAHDLNNQLHAVCARIGLAMRVGVSPEAQVHLEEAQRYAEEAAALSAQLRLLSRGSPPQRAPVDLGVLLRRAASLASDTQIALELSLPDAPVVAKVDAVQMMQLLSNLVHNAIQAMPTGGRLRLELTVRPCETPPERARPCARVRISDTGVGIEATHLPRIFQAHYTTRSEGTGLGLAICQSVARRHNAKLSCESKAGEGTTFELVLPL